MVSNHDPPVAGRSSLERPPPRSKWSRRGRRMRRILLSVWKVVAMIVSALRILKWLLGNL